MAICLVGGCLRMPRLFCATESPQCVCPVVADPVCGIDGVTYNNICHAKCNGIVEFKCAKSCDKCNGKEQGIVLSLWKRFCCRCIVTVKCKFKNLSRDREIERQQFDETMKGFQFILCISFVERCQNVKNAVSARKGRQLAAVRVGLGGVSVEISEKPSTAGVKVWQLVRV